MALAAKRLFDVSGKVAVVTGGGRGIGLMIANAFVNSGVKVYITSRTAEACEKAAKSLSEQGPGQCIAIPKDLSSSAHVAELVGELEEREKHVNVLVGLFFIYCSPHKMSASP